MAPVDDIATRPWDRRSGETARAFTAFSTYLRLGPRRSLAAAFAADSAHRRNTGGTPEEGTPAPRHWERWSAAHEWVARAEAWDQHELEQLRTRREVIREKARERIIERIDELTDTLVDIALGKVTLVDGRADRARVAAVQAALELAGIGKLEPQRVDVEVTGPGGGPVAVSVEHRKRAVRAVLDGVSPEAVDALREIAERAATVEVERDRDGTDST